MYRERTSATFARQPPNCPTKICVIEFGPIKGFDKVPRISESVTVNANIESVFDLISRVEEFPLYASMLKEVRQIGYHTYRWVARIRGLTLNWDSTITEFSRPTRLTWRSTRGFENSGTYHLVSIPGGTRVELTIQYSFDGALFGRLMEALVAPIAGDATASVLGRVKNRLEHNHSASPAKDRMHHKLTFPVVLTKKGHPDRRA
jgi:uncharacterized membrane protein